VNSALVNELLGSDDDRVLGEEGHVVHVIGPHHILDERGGEFRQGGALLHVEEHDLVLGAAKEGPCPRVEDGVGGGHEGGALLGDLVA